jgi:hypothetical protein
MTNIILILTASYSKKTSIICGLNIAISSLKTFAIVGRKELKSKRFIRFIFSIWMQAMTRISLWEQNSCCILDPDIIVMHICSIPTLEGIFVFCNQLDYPLNIWLLRLVLYSYFNIYINDMPGLSDFNFLSVLAGIMLADH